MDRQRGSPQARQTPRLGQTSRAGQTPKPPISLEGERRQALKLIFAMEKEADAFRERWLFNETDDNTEDWIEFINLAKASHGANFVYKNYQAFAKDLVKLRNDSGYLGSRVMIIAQLQRVCDRARIFEELFESCFNRIEEALNMYMTRYCLSYFAELDELDVRSVREYENCINEWTMEIKQCLKDAETAMDNLTEISEVSFSDYINSYGQILHFMGNALDAFTSVCDPFRSWVTADEGYVKKIRIEMEYVRKQRDHIYTLVKKNAVKVAEVKAKGLRSKFDNKKLDQMVHERLDSRRFCRKREFSFVDKIEMAENVLHERKLELEEALTKVKTRPMHTLVRENSDGMKAKAAELQKEVNRLEQELKQMKRGKRDMRETRYTVQKEYHDLKNSYETSIRKSERLSGHRQNQEQTVKELQEQLKITERKLKAMEHIIDLKTNPATIKKIFFQGYSPGEKIDFRDTLREAIDVAATGVGKDWDKMYQNLPFSPPRDPLLRSQDLDVIEMNFRSIHPPSEQMALRSLDKWKHLSKVTSVNALVRTLRSIKKTEVAKKIEKKVLTVVN